MEEGLQPTRVHITHVIIQPMKHYYNYLPVLLIENLLILISASDSPWIQTSGSSVSGVTDRVWRMK